MKTRRYWPWTSVLALVFFGVVILLFLLAFAGEMALHRISKAMSVVGIFIFIAIASTMILLRIRNRFDYFIDVDDQQLRRWTPTGELVLRREDVTDIEWFPESFTIRTTTAQVTITKAYAGYRSLMRVVLTWQD